MFLFVIDAEEKDELLKATSGKFLSILNEVDNIHQEGTYSFLVNGPIRFDLLPFAMCLSTPALLYAIMHQLLFYAVLCNYHPLCYV